MLDYLKASDDGSMGPDAKFRFLEPVIPAKQPLTNAHNALESHSVTMVETNCPRVPTSSSGPESIEPAESPKLADMSSPLQESSLRANQNIATETTNAMEHRLETVALTTTVTLKAPVDSRDMPLRSLAHPEKVRMPHCDIILF
jgi:hypothetical protein